MLGKAPQRSIEQRAGGAREANVQAAMGTAARGGPREEPWEGRGRGRRGRDRGRHGKYAYAAAGGAREAVVQAVMGKATERARETARGGPRARPWEQPERMLWEGQGRGCGWQLWETRSREAKRN